MSETERDTIITALSVAYDLKPGMAVNDTPERVADAIMASPLFAAVLPQGGPSDAQVDAAAIVMFQQSAGLLLKWDTRPDYLKDSFRNDARAVLRAARDAR